MSKFDRGVSLLCWAYNEEDSIGEYLEKAARLMSETVEDYEIVLIDDGSTDRTYEIARAYQDRCPNLRIVRNEKNMNVGACIVRAIDSASKECLFWQTVDWCYDITDLRLFLEYLKRYDIVQGVRRKPVEVKFRLFKPFAALLKMFRIKQLTRRSDTVSKAMVSVVNYIIIRLLFRVPVSDFQNVTFYPAKWIKTVTIEARSAFTNPELLIKSYWNGMSIKEVPINFLPRNKGIPKGTSAQAIKKAVKDISGLWLKWVVFGRRNFVSRGKVVRLDPKEWGE
jgi:glycosyltransferase involved in cell wall biosynthesis